MKEFWWRSQQLLSLCSMYNNNVHIEIIAMIRRDVEVDGIDYIPTNVESLCTYTLITSNILSLTFRNGDIPDYL